MAKCALRLGSPLPPLPLSPPIFLSADFGLLPMSFEPTSGFQVPKSPNPFWGPSLPPPQIPLSVRRGNSSRRRPSSCDAAGLRCSPCLQDLNSLGAFGGALGLFLFGGGGFVQFPFLSVPHHLPDVGSFLGHPGPLKAVPPCAPHPPPLQPWVWGGHVLSPCFLGGGGSSTASP